MCRELIWVWDTLKPRQNMFSCPSALCRLSAAQVLWFSEMRSLVCVLMSVCVCLRYLAAGFCAYSWLSIPCWEKRWRGLWLSTSETERIAPKTRYSPHDSSPSGRWQKMLLLDRTSRKLALANICHFTRALQIRGFSAWVVLSQLEIAPE